MSKTKIRLQEMYDRLEQLKTLVDGVEIFDSGQLKDSDIDPAIDWIDALGDSIETIQNFIDAEFSSYEQFKTKRIIKKGR